MKILLLGATGQIGYALAMALAWTEHEVSVLVRNKSLLKFPDNVTVIDRPEFSLGVFAEALRDVDHVIYGIGLPEQFLFDDSVFDKVNCDMLQAFLEAMRGSHVRRLTYISTYEVFRNVNGIIDETHPIADETHMSPYSQSKVRAYRSVLDFARTSGVQLTTIHPAAVYGGLNTGDGITNYMTNLASWKWHRVPFVSEGEFPVIHVDSLTDLIIKSLDMPGAYIASDQMASLKGIAQAMRMQEQSYVPVVMPLRLVKLGVSMMETMAKVIRVKPIASSVQTEFITRGWRPDPHKAIRELNWQQMPLEEGLRRFRRGRNQRAAGQ